MTMFDDLLKTINELKMNQPPKREIWLTTSMPYKDDKGELVIMKLDIAALNQKRGFYLNLQLYETITGADEVILMNPMTFDRVKDAFEVPQSPDQIISSIYGVPVFDDDYRREFFKNKYGGKE